MENRLPMESTPQTAEALRELARQGEVSLGVELYAMARRVRTVVPELIGISLAAIEDGLTLTLVASAEELAALDAVQYVDGGPCVEAVERAEPLEVKLRDLLDEGDWQLYALAGAAHGVASTLSLPIMVEDRVVGGVNLYGYTEDAFTGRHAEVAEAVSSTAELAVTNADLSFRTRAAASEAPTRIREGSDINIALGIISTSQNVNIPVARQRLLQAARRAGISEAQAARAIKHIRADHR
jgi:GAF domain-containing protein